MLWVKWLHIVFMVTWFAGLFYLPRLFVYHADATDQVSRQRFKLMERRLYLGIMTPGGVLTVVFGTWLWVGWNFSGNWLVAKLVLVALLVLYHAWCGLLLLEFHQDRNRHSARWYRWFNEVPTLALFAIVFLVVFKPS